MKLLPILLPISVCAAGLMVIGADNQGLDLTLRRLKETAPKSGQWQVEQSQARWNPAQTTVVICDMWDTHWCKGAARRCAEIAPRMNELVSALRERGAFIIHCPSDTMKFYEGQPGRKLAQAAPRVDLQPILERNAARAPKDEPPLPLDASDGGCDDDPQCVNPSPHGPWPWKCEIPGIEIKPGDAIAEKNEPCYLLLQRGITNVIIMGVHENMCIVARPFGIRQLVRLGMNVVLVRDMTDCLYNSRRKPFVNHFVGTDLVCWHIEKYWCPSITSDQIIGGKPFRFAGDTAPARVFRNASN